MGKQSTRIQRLVALFLLGCVLFNYPLLALFSTNGFILGIPILYGYMFTVWIALIGLVALVVEKLR